jgi:two-component sensor histidine kinase
MSNEHKIDQQSPSPASSAGVEREDRELRPQDDHSSALDQAFLREVHHRVKNNLQVVCSLLRLQSRSLTDSSARTVFKRSEERIQSMALVYDKLYRGNGYDTVPLDEYLREMVNQLVCSARPRAERPQLDFCLDAVTVSSKTATAVGLLLNEVVSHHLRDYVSSAPTHLRFILSSDESQISIELQEDTGTTSERVPLGDMEQQILDALLKQVQGAITYEVNGRIHTRIVFAACGAGC